MQSKMLPYLLERSKRSLKVFNIAHSIALDGASLLEGMVSSHGRSLTLPKVVGTYVLIATLQALHNYSILAAFVFDQFHTPSVTHTAITNSIKCSLYKN